MEMYDGYDAYSSYFTGSSYKSCIKKYEAYLIETNELIVSGEYSDDTFENLFPFTPLEYLTFKLNGEFTLWGIHYIDTSKE